MKDNGRCKYISIFLFVMIIAFIIQFEEDVLAATSNSSTTKVESQESTEQKRTATIRIPYLDYINDVTVDNGNVEHSVDGDDVSITVSDGDWVSREEYWDSTKYSKYASSYSTGSSSSFPRSKYYSNDGYSGYLNQSGSSYVISGSYTPSSSKYVNSYGYGYSEERYSCSGGSWKTTYVYRTNNSANKPYYSDSDGYKGYLSYEDHWSIYTTDSRYWPCSEGDTARFYNRNKIRYGGTVTKPASDTRTWRQDYKGTIYKGGISYRNHTYAYVVTVNYVNMSVNGFVTHTPRWKDIHNEIGNPLTSFYSGETFVLEAITADAPVDRITVDFNGTRINEHNVSKTTLLSKKTNTEHVGELFDRSFLAPATRLRDGQVNFLFTVYYSNGEIRTSSVNANIIGSAYDIVNLHRAY